MTHVYVIDGSKVTSLEAFFTAVGEAVNGPGGYFGRNLDALADCLRGGFGTPEDNDFVIEWRDHHVSRDNLSYPETARRLRQLLTTRHPTNVPRIQDELTAAELGTGPTVFEVLVEILSEDGKLRLA